MHQKLFGYQTLDRSQGTYSRHLNELNMKELKKGLTETKAGIKKKKRGHLHPKAVFRKLCFYA